MTAYSLEYEHMAETHILIHSQAPSMHRLSCCCANWLDVVLKIVSVQSPVCLQKRSCPFNSESQQAVNRKWLWIKEGGGLKVHFHFAVRLLSPRSSSVIAVVFINHTGRDESLLFCVSVQMWHRFKPDTESSPSSTVNWQLLSSNSTVHYLVTVIFTAAL